METPDAAEPVAETPSPTPQPDPQVHPTVALLEKWLLEARAGRLASVLIAYSTPEGNSEIVTTPMPITVLNHFARLLDRRVDREYDRVSAASRAARSPGTMPARGAESGPGASPPATSNKVVRRQLAKAELRRRVHGGGGKRAGKTK